MPKHGEISVSRLLEVFDYDKDSGLFTWKINRTKGVKAGQVAGTCNWAGYISLQVDGVKMLAHRAALAMSGFAINGLVDHKNGIRNDNKLSNLRVVTNSENLQNSTVASRRSKSGLKGVSWRSSTQKWRACITVNGRHKELGAFSSIEDASNAYLKAKKEFHLAWLDVPSKEIA